MRNRAIQISRKAPMHTPPEIRKPLDTCLFDFLNMKPAISKARPTTMLITGKYEISRYNHSISITLFVEFEFMLHLYSLVFEPSVQFKKAINNCKNRKKLHGRR